MKIVVAVDSFKGSLSSLQAGNAAAEGIKRVFPKAQITVCPIADGGEGTADSLTEGLGGQRQKVNVIGPLGNEIEAWYGIVSDNMAVMEMSAAAGITLVPKGQANPLNTTTYGVGQMIVDAINKGCRNFIIGIGGSATNDCGIGMLQALGFGLLDKNGNQVEFGAKGIKNICKITRDNVLPQLKECTFNIACDVTNPLCGQNGCSRVYGGQKGANEQMINNMDNWIQNFANLVEGADVNMPGAGAAGGLGFAFVSFLGATLKKGIDLVLKETKVENLLKDADFVVTGEGRLDGQTTMGKVPVGVAKIAKKYNVPVIALSGSVTDESRQCNDHGIDAFFAILRQTCTLEQAMQTDYAYKNMVNTAEQVFRSVKIGYKDALD